MTRSIGLPALVVALALCACGARPAPAASPSPAPTGAVTAKVVVASDADDGRVLTLQVGQQLQLVLSSTYWRVAGSSNASALRQSGAQAVSPRPGCVPGGGCGTVTAVFDAVAPGRADVSAARTSCGEALACTGSAGSYRVTVVVTG